MSKFTKEDLKVLLFIFGASGVGAFGASDCIEAIAKRRKKPYGFNGPLPYIRYETKTLAMSDFDVFKRDIEREGHIDLYSAIVWRQNGSEKGIPEYFKAIEWNNLDDVLIKKVAIGRKKTTYDLIFPIPMTNYNKEEEDYE